MSSILVLSDLHLCKWLSNVSDVSQLRTLWRGFDELILNGDTEETYSSRNSVKSKMATAKLIKIAEDDGLKVRILNGNHDPMISDNHYYSSHNDTVLIFHGHAIFPEVAPWTWYGKTIASHRRKLINELGDSFESQLLATQLASEKSASGGKNKNKPTRLTLPIRVVWCVHRILRAWKDFPKLSADWIASYAPTSKFVVVGHTHRAGIWEIDGRVYINMGCFGFPSHPLAVVIENNTLRCFRVLKKNNSFYLGQDLGSWQLEAL